MSLGGNLSSGYTDNLTERVMRAGLMQASYSDKCSNCSIPGKTPVAVYPSMLLHSRINSCPPITPAQFALYPKVAVPSSIRTQLLVSPIYPVDPISRFSQYERYRIPVPCQPLPQSANMAGISLPSKLECNIYPNT
jgi:hypothetical protein